MTTFLRYRLQKVDMFEVACLAKEDVDVDRTYLWVLHKFADPYYDGTYENKFTPTQCRIDARTALLATFEPKKGPSEKDNYRTCLPCLSNTPRRGRFIDNCVGTIRPFVDCWCKSEKDKPEEKHTKANFLVADLNPVRLADYYDQVEQKKGKTFMILEDTVILWERSSLGDSFHFKLKDPKQLDEIIRVLEDPKLMMGCVFEGIITTDEEVDYGHAYPTRTQKLVSFRGGICFMDSSGIPKRL